MKRTIDLVEDICAEMRPVKRISMLYNTPKQRKEQRKAIMRMSRAKLQQLGDVERNLLRSVQLNNTYRKMRSELREKCPYSPPSSPPFDIFADLASHEEASPAHRCSTKPEVRHNDVTSYQRQTPIIDANESAVVAMDTADAATTQSTSSSNDATRVVATKTDDACVAMETGASAANVDDVTPLQPIDYSLKTNSDVTTSASAAHKDEGAAREGRDERERSTIDEHHARSTQDTATLAPQAPTFMQGQASVASLNAKSSAASEADTSQDTLHGHCAQSGQESDRSAVASESEAASDVESFIDLFLRSPLGRNDVDDAEAMETDSTLSEGQAEEVSGSADVQECLDLSITSSNCTNTDMLTSDDESVTSPASSTCSECESDASSQSADDVSSCNASSVTSSSWANSSCSFHQHFNRSCSNGVPTAAAAVLACS